MGVKSSDSHPPGNRATVEVMDNRHEVQQFLTALRARITPEQAGITTFGGERRVPGLRREEVAQLADCSTATTSAWNAVTSMACPRACCSP